jgi:excisionase family DNA binding protein
MATATLKSTNAYLLPSEAAELLRVSERHLRDLTKAGAIPCIRLAPRTIRYKRSDLIEANCFEKRNAADGTNGSH